MRDSLSRELRDQYYFIDYLRLHRYGKQNGIWKKNRNMLVKECEYSNDANVVSRKGYKLYIQRCMKSILEYLNEGFDIIKPRNTFGYEIGKRDRNFGATKLNMAEDNEDRVRFILQRYLIEGKYSDIIAEYRDAVLNSSFLSFKNNESGIKIKLSEKRSFGYPAVMDLLKVKDAQAKMIAEANDTNKIIKELILCGLSKIKKIPMGTFVEVIGNNLRGVVLSSSMSGSDFSITVQLSNGMTTTEPRRNIRILNEENVSDITSINSSPLVDRVIDYARNNFTSAAGINSDAIFRLSRSAVVSQLNRESNTQEANELRRLEPTSEMLSRITTDHSVTLCGTCEYPEDECECCSECGEHRCVCEEDLEEWDN